MIRGSTFRPGMEANCTKPPRQREGLSTQKKHNVYPGGKKLRKALANLAARRASRDATIADLSRDRPGIRDTLRNIPGSMK